VIEGWQLDAHPDVVDSVRRLAGAGVRLVTLTNGARSVAESLLERAGVRGPFERLLSVEEAGEWKPARAAYEYGLQACGVTAERSMLVAVPWDIDLRRAGGVQTAWLDRSGSSPYPPFFQPAEVEASSLVQLADELGAWRAVQDAERPPARAGGRSDASWVSR